MKIKEIRCSGLSGDTPEGGWSHELKPEDCIHTLIALVADDDRVGLGSVFTSELLVNGALSILRPLLLGETVFEPERVAETLHQNTFWPGRGGAITHTISGIDIALWDLFGQVTGQPVGRLLGGCHRRKVRPYASILADHPGSLEEKISRVRERGFRAFKIGWGPFGRHSPGLDREIVAAAREAAGKDSLLMVDAGGSDAFWPRGLKWALKTADMLAEYDVTWFEEPLSPDQMQDFVRLREHSPVPISGGEVLTRRQDFQPWLEAGALDIVQPDVTKAGGISEVRRVTWLAESHGIQMIPHGWNTAVGLVTDLHLASAFPHTDLVEFIEGSPFVDELLKEPFQLDEEGMLPIPQGPGLGAVLDPDRVRPYLTNKSFLEIFQ